MKLGIMQPYFLPYVGYFQLMAAVDQFVVYDDVEYTKKGWINRNRILVAGKDAFMTLPLKKASDFLDVRERALADTWPDERRRLLARVSAAYRKAPHYDEAWPVFERCLASEERNLFGFILASLREVADYLGIRTPLVPSSSLGVDRALRGQERVLAICERAKADCYVNPIGGVELYAREAFAARGVELRFLKAELAPYPQLGGEFVPALSILDVMMFNPRAELARILGEGYALS